jgi:selenocysteine lyase/cysteine desulfurase
MLSSQKHLFQLPDDIVYLNGAYMSPLLQSVEEAGIAGMQKKRNPGSIQSSDFFDEVDILRQRLATLVNAHPKQVAIIPSASYGLASVVNNLPLHNGKYAVTVGEEFPSDQYTIANWCRKYDKELKIIAAPIPLKDRGKMWNENLLHAIDKDTAVVILSSIHWADGSKFDLQKIGERCKEMNAIFIVDGTQSVGVMPMDVNKFKIDALVCAAYKWLLGPYSIGFSYVSEYFNEGKPLEESWMNRINASDFTSLTNYVDGYKPGAARFQVGEASNFVLTPMFVTAVEQILKWEVEEINSYCKNLVSPLQLVLQAKDFWIEEEDYRASHLFGFQLPFQYNTRNLFEFIMKRKINVSLRGNTIRVSTHVYNTERDIEALSEAIIDF